MGWLKWLTGRRSEVVWGFAHRSGVGRAVIPRQGRIWLPFVPTPGGWLTQAYVGFLCASRAAGVTAEAVDGQAQYGRMGLAPIATAFLAHISRVCGACVQKPTYLRMQVAF